MGNPNVKSTEHRPVLNVENIATIPYMQEIQINY
jgi:hypothetical protein